MASPGDHILDSLREGLDFSEHEMAQARALLTMLCEDCGLGDDPRGINLIKHMTLCFLMMMRQLEEERGLSKEQVANKMIVLFTTLAISARSLEPKET